MTWISSNVTGWGAVGALLLSLFGALLTERVVTRRQLNRAVAVEQKITELYKQGMETERQRTDAVLAGLVTVVKEIRTAVGDPTRPL